MEMSEISAKTNISEAEMEAHSNGELNVINQVNRMQKEIHSNLSPKYMEKKTGSRVSRFGRPQTIRKSDDNSIPTEVSKFIPKHSPKRLKPKDSNIDDKVTPKRQNSLLQGKENTSKNPQDGVKDGEQPAEIKEEEPDFATDISRNDAELNAVADVNQEVNSDDEKSKDFSDTDSALGSAVSYNDIKDEEFVAGQIVWGSFNRSSWYPCMVYPNLDGNVIDENGKTKCVNVKYFNWNGCVATLPIKNIIEFKDIDDFWSKVKALGVKKSKTKPFSKSLLKAIEEAHHVKKYPIDERMKVLDEIVVSQREQKTQKSQKGKTGERKSVDSAIENSVSPTPLSPQSDTVKKEIQSDSFMQMNESLTAEVKTPVVDDNRRKSTRTIKKRKFKDFVEDIRSEASELAVFPSTSTVEPKAKRVKIVKTESLEERFSVSAIYLRNMFRSNKKRVCIECLQMDNEPTFRCAGNGIIKCTGWFHKDCSGHFEMKHEEIRHQTGDSDEIIQTQAIKTVLMCKPCHVSVKNCFICSKPVDPDDADTSQNCSNNECRLSFHKDCLQLWPQSKSSGGKRNNFCPQHTCHTCFSKDIHNGGALIKCVKCPSAYHIQSSCIPAGTIVLSQSQILCPRHRSAKETAKEKNVKHLNVEWCNICNDSGHLVCCENCPNAFHTNCINYVETNENYICPECQQGRLPLYNTIVWARVGAYRWWPALIMPPLVLPETVLKTQKYDREFCVRFFGSYDYFWTTCERVINYDGTNPYTKSGNSRIDSAFILALDEARQWANILFKEKSNITTKPKPYNKILQNKPIPPVKLKKPDEHTQEKCGCKPTDDDPCGRTSDCLNMHLNFECTKSTCPAGDKCQNQKLANRDDTELKIIRTESRGFGAICVNDVPDDTFITEYIGELIDQNELNRRMAEKIKNKEHDYYFLTIESDLYVDAEPSGNLARFINHSCDPNCITRKITVDGNTRIGIFSNGPIKAGTELTFDYQMEFIGDKKTPCTCGSKKCSGFIGEKIKEETVSMKKKKKVPSKRPAPKPVVVPAPKPRRQRALNETRDPFNAMLKEMVSDFEPKQNLSKDSEQSQSNQNEESEMPTVKELKSKPSPNVSSTTVEPVELMETEETVKIDEVVEKEN